MKNLFVALMAIIFFSCASKSTHYEDISDIRLDIPVGEVQKVILSNIISEYKIVKLEFTEQSMIGDIRKIIVQDGLIYILDTFGAKSLMVFNFDGRFIQRVGSIGQGPGQSLSPKDFIISGVDKEIEILGNRKINIFTLNGQFKRDCTIDFGSVDFAKIGIDYFFVDGGTGNHILYKTNSDYKITTKYLPKSAKALLMNVYRPLMKKDDSHLYFWSMVNDTIYSVSANEFFPARIIDYGKYKFRYSDYLSLPFEKQTQILLLKENKNQCLTVRYFENSDYVHIVYNMSSRFYEYIYNKKTHKAAHFDREHLIDDITWEKDSWYLIGADDKYFYYMVQPYKYHSISQLCKFLKNFTSDEKKIREMTLETSNPIILMAKYKL
ncbi:MAG: 6-bladed beta-propeller [Mangrovibacterium sp.]